MTERPPIPIGFGQDYLQVVFEAGAQLGASRLAAVFVNLAYQQDSTTVSAGERLLRRSTALRDGRSLDKALAWLVDRGLVTRETIGRGTRRSTWALAPAPGRALADHFAADLRRQLDEALAERQEP